MYEMNGDETNCSQLWSPAFSNVLEMSWHSFIVMNYFHPFHIKYCAMSKNLMWHSS
jgi:hypothetical protein